MKKKKETFYEETSHESQEASKIQNSQLCDRAKDVSLWTVFLEGLWQNVTSKRRICFVQQKI